MKLLKNLPIKQKVLAVVLLISAAGLLLTGGLLSAFRVYSFQSRFPRELAADGWIMASHSVGPLALNDPASAAQMMDALKAKPHISEAQLRLPNGTLFARSGRDPQWTPTPGRGLRHQGPYLIYSEPLTLDGEHIGILHLRADYRDELLALLRLHALVLVVVVTFSIILTVLLSTRLQRVISEPILSLSETAKTIAARKDFSLRARKLEDDEIGQFTDAFNEMLSEIQLRDTALHASREKLETLINTIEGVVWEADPTSLDFTFVSAQAERLLGLSPAQWMKPGEFWKGYVHPDDRQTAIEELHRAIRERRPCAQEYRLEIPGREMIWARSYTNVVIQDGSLTLLRGVLLDVTREKKAAEERAQHAAQLETSRHAGMAEVATGVLHNVGNVLNSVNVSTTIVCDRIRHSEVATLAQLSGLLQQHAHDMPTFLSTDPKGRMVPEFVQQLASRLQQEHSGVLRELELLAKNIEHIKEIVAMQQSYARVAGVTESLAPADLVDDALQINAAGFERHGVAVVKEFTPAPKVLVDRHKVLQILINLFRNAKYALDEKPGGHKQVSIGIAANGQGTVHITVKDNGMGISRENLTRIFSHGFTTKKNGHGFGLHSGAIAAKQMGGRLLAHSDGPGTGASFTLELPMSKEAKI